MKHKFLQKRHVFNLQKTKSKDTFWEVCIKKLHENIHVEQAINTNYLASPDGIPSDILRILSERVLTHFME